MERKVKADQIPSQAHRLYLQLYCERKGVKDKKTIQEAKKSWASLSHSKKKVFYKTTSKRNLLNYAHGLRQTTTYLKEKASKLDDKKLCELTHSNEELSKELQKHESIVTINESCVTENGSHNREEHEFINDKTKNNTNLEGDNETHVINIGTPEPKTQPNEGRPLCELSPPHSTNNTKSQEDDKTQDINIGSPLCDPDSPNPVDEIEDAIETQSNASTVQIAVPLPEPTPPTIKVGKDLYAMIKPPGSAEWKTIAKKDKRYYNTAVLAIKREYINNYTKYLESLSQQQLFDHYIKTLY